MVAEERGKLTQMLRGSLAERFLQSDATPEGFDHQGGQVKGNLCARMGTRLRIGQIRRGDNALEKTGGPRSSGRGQSLPFVADRHPQGCSDRLTV